MTRDFGGQNTGLMLNLKLESTLLRTLNKIRSTFNASILLRTNHHQISLQTVHGNYCQHLIVANTFN